MVSEIKSFLFKSKARAIALITAVLLVVGAGSTLAYFSDHVGAQLYLTIARWKGDPVIQQWEEGAMTDFHAYKDSITSITFLNEFDTESSTYLARTSEVWDVSYAKDETVMAYMVGDEVYIASNVGGKADIIANPYSSFAYDDFGTVNTVTGTENMDTSHAITMESMFRYFGISFNDGILPSLDLSTWDTSKVTTMKSMFESAYFFQLEVGNFNTSKVEDMSFMFASCSGYPTLDVSNWDVSNVTTMEGMFHIAFYGTGDFSLDVSNWDTGKVKNMKDMFHYGERLTTLDVSNWDVSNVETMESMFSGCTGMESFGATGLSNWKTGALKNTTSAFQNCCNLTVADISKWNMSRIENSDYMFLGCSSLKELTIPASYKNVGIFFAAECPAMTTITFLHAENDPIVFPEAGSDTGAFYLDNYVQTHIIGLDTVQKYDWITDHRRLEPVIDTWCYGTEKGYTWDNDIGTMGGYVLPGVDFHTEALAPTITSIVFDDHDAYWAYPGMTSGDSNGVVDGVNVWDVSAAQDKSVIAWIDNAGKLTIAADGPEVIANENSGFLFALFENVVTIDATKYDTSRAENINHWHWFNDPDMHPGEPEFAIPMTGATTILGMETWDVSNVSDFSSMFHNDKNLKNIDVSTWDTSSAVYMDGVFLGCDRLTELDVSSWDMTNVVTIESMFCRASGLTSDSGISQWVMPNLENMEHTFSRTNFESLNLNKWMPEKLISMYMSFADSNIKSIDMTQWSTPNLAYLQGTFFMTRNLKSLDLKNFTTNKVVTMYQMCEGSGIKTIDLTGWDFSVCADVDSMFQDAAQLEEVTGEDTWTNMHGIKCMTRMFSGCEALKSLDVTDWDVSNVSGSYSFNFVFQDCKSIEVLDVKNWNVSKGGNFEAMFKNCESLKEIDISNWVLSSFSYNSYFADIFNGCKSLTELIFPERINFFTNRMAANCPNLTRIEFLTERSLDSRVNAGATYGAFYVAPDSGVEIPVITEYITHSPGMASLRSLYEWNKDNRAFPSFTVTYNANGGEFEGHSTSNAVEYASADHIITGEYKEPTINNIYKYFDGWYTTPNCSDGTEFDLNACYTNTTVYAKWSEIPHFKVTYDANGGTFADGSSTNIVEYSIDVSKTDNINPDGSVNTNYYKNDLLFLDTIKMPNATSLEVTVTYQTENTSYDWVCVYDGSVTPSTSNTGSSVSGKLGGSTKKTVTYTIPGDTVQFYFKSDGSVNEYYGYYATVKAIISGSYKDPIRDESCYTFDTWYRDRACTEGNVFNEGTVTEDITVYAKWNPVLPVLAKTSTWYSQGRPNLNGTAIAKSEITSITLVDSYDPTGKSIVDQWDASDQGTGAADNEGPVTAYLEYDATGTTYQLTIAGNGYGKIMANEDSDNAFESFSKATSMNSFGLLDTGNTTSMYRMFSGCSSVTAAPDTSHWNTENVESMDLMFDGNKAMVTPPDTSNWDTSNVTSMMSMFSTCYAMATPPDTSAWDTSKVTNMFALFRDCQSMTTPPETGNWDTSSVTNLNHLFYQCYVMASAPDIGDWNTNCLTSASGMFFNCYAMADTPDVATKLVENADGSTYTAWNTSALTDISSMFYSCKSITVAPDVSLWNTSNVDDISGIFSHCSSMATTPAVGNWDTRFVTSMAAVFNYCKSMSAAPAVGKWNTSNVTSMNGLFCGCESMQTPPDTATKLVTNADGATYTAWDTSLVTTMNSMFDSCSSMIAAPDTSGWSTSNVTDIRSMFFHCESMATTPDTSGWDVSKVTSFYELFGSCHNMIAPPDTSNWVTSAVTDMSTMFDSCLRMEAAPDMSNWDTSSVTTMRTMFSGCNEIYTIDLGSFDTRAVTSMYGMFGHCNILSAVNLSSFDFSNVTNMNQLFLNCNNTELTIYVKDEASKAKVEATSDFPEDATVIVGAPTVMSLSFDPSTGTLNGYEAS